MNRSHGGGQNSITHSIAWQRQGTGSSVGTPKSFSPGDSLVPSTHHSAISGSAMKQQASQKQQQLYSRNGVDLTELSRGQVRNYSCSDTISLDPDLMRLLEPDRNILDLSRDVIAAHARNVLNEIQIR